MTKESTFQINVVRMLRSAGLFVFAVPNGGTRNYREAHNLRLQGVMAGVSDLILLLPQGKTYFIELKNLNGKGRQSPAQRDFEAQVELLGHTYLLWSSWAEVEDFINKHRHERQDLANSLQIGGTE